MRVRLVVSEEEANAGMLNAKDSAVSAEDGLIANERATAVTRAMVAVAEQLTPKQAEILWEVRRQLEAQGRVVLAEVARVLRRDRTSVSKAWGLVLAHLKQALHEHQDT